LAKKKIFLSGRKHHPEFLRIPAVVDVSKGFQLAELFMRGGFRRQRFVVERVGAFNGFKEPYETIVQSDLLCAARGRVHHVLPLCGSFNPPAQREKEE
jgi:hypothetical protein